MTHKTFGTSLLAIGAVIVLIGSQMSLKASLTKQGSYLGTQEVDELMWVDQGMVLPAAAIESSSSTGVLAFGMLMMLIGFGLHALWIIRKNDEQPVPVRIRKKAPKKEPRNLRRQMEVIWIERTIRF